ncbi:unnamed protein product [Staurois parvus]|uniref:Uncharacterized protein n=1 Tax=Staurois parvus TaxID=386267 RepID=A0ABN9G097_9NEOB|nr:unnamed protein product [Staurois parvus]
MHSGHPAVNRVSTLKGRQLRGSGSRYLSNSGQWSLGHPMYCLQSLGHPLYCLQSLVIPCTVFSLWSSPVLSSVSGHPLYCLQSLVIPCTV